VYGRPSYNLTFRRIRGGTGHGLSIGSEMSAGISDVLFEDIVFNGTDYGPRVKSGRGRGGYVANVRDVRKGGRGFRSPPGARVTHLPRSPRRAPGPRSAPLQVTYRNIVTHGVPQAVYREWALSTSDRVRETGSLVPMSRPPPTTHAPHDHHPPRTTSPHSLTTRTRAVTMTYNSSTYPPANLSGDPVFANITIANLTVASVPSHGKSVGFSSVGLKDSTIGGVTLADVDLRAAGQPAGPCEYTAGACAGAVLPACPPCLAPAAAAPAAAEPGRPGSGAGG
jgi:hypothetical protein